MPLPAPRVFTIPASAPFLPTLFEAFLAGKIIPGHPLGRDPLALAQATFYLPTRRACRIARDFFLQALGTEAAVLPRIVPIGDIDEDELVFADAATGAAAPAALDLPPALGGLERRMLLARLVLQWARASEVRGVEGARLVAYSPASALALADELARLMDDMATRQVPWSKLDTLVPDEFDQYWQLSLKFLEIARDAWPQILAERGLIEPVARRDRLIASEAARLAACSDRPVIAAGSTGSIPATAALLEAIGRLPHGAVVLPGLDCDMPEGAWKTIGGSAEGASPVVGHPQFAMQALLARLGIERREVAVIGNAAPHGRERLASEALCPAAASECWRQRLPEATIAAALAGISVIEAGNAEEEALAVAVALREAVEDGKTAALTTPDRALARRVIAALGRWNIEADDSAGDRLTDTPAGIFARLAADAALAGLEPATLLAVLKHPRTCLDAGEGRHRAATEALERAVLRGPRPQPGAAGLSRALDTLRQERHSLYRTDPRRSLFPSDLDAAAALVTRLDKALAPLATLGPEALPFADLATRHREVVVALAQGSGSTNLAFAGDDGRALVLAFEDVIATGADFAVAPSDYAELFDAAIGDRMVRKPSMPGARVRIFGLLEARLQSVERMVLGGLVEETWPPEARTDAWLSRPMRRELGLDLPERRIGLTAHDFAQGLGAPEVILTRAAKIAGAPTLWSRFVQRLAAVAGKEAWAGALRRGDKYVTLARSLDHPAQAKPVRAPAPRPPAELRPASLSVTEIEDWLRDPYTIYAKHVLGLMPLNAIDTPPGAADRGSAIHNALGEFTKAYATGLPTDPVGELIKIGEKHFAPLQDFPEARAFWWPRYLRIARWFAAWDIERRAAAKAIHAEAGGKITFALGTRSFELRGRADRIEQANDGRYVILDFKTGAPPTEPQVRTGFSPQLTLEAAMLSAGGFEPIESGASVAELIYVRLSGGEPAGRESKLDFKNGDAARHAAAALDRLSQMAGRFLVDGEPYRSLVNPKWRTRYGDYDHLARVKEWSLTGGETEDME